MQRTTSARLTNADLSVLGPLAEHRVLIVPQIALILGVSHDAAARRMRRLRTGGMVSYGVIYTRGPGIASITAKGLQALGRPASEPPGFNATEYRHDIGVAWLWLAARSGVFGRLDGMITEPAMIAADRSAAAARRPPDGYAPHGLGLGLVGPHGHPRRHYPDLLLSTHTGHRVALELELTAKSRQRMDQIMTAYASDGRVDLVVYLVPDAGVAQTVSAAAQRAGIGDIVQVRRLAPEAIQGADGIAPLRRHDAARSGPDRCSARGSESTRRRQELER